MTKIVKNILFNFFTCISNFLIQKSLHCQIIQNNCFQIQCNLPNAIQRKIFSKEWVSYQLSGSSQRWVSHRTIICFIIIINHYISQLHSNYQIINLRIKFFPHKLLVQNITRLVKSKIISNFMSSHDRNVNLHLIRKFRTSTTHRVIVGRQKINYCTFSSLLSKNGLIHDENWNSRHKIRNRARVLCIL